MPVIPHNKRRSAFEACFRRSKRGNLWRKWEGLSVTVFRRPGGGWYGWSIANEDGPRFSPGGYPDEERALEALWDALEDG
jgi:hypothetical protein